MATNWSNLAAHLRKRSTEICADNNCNVDEGEHRCESYAYITANGALLDICMPDYFAGCSFPYAAISLPWHGNGDDLDSAVAMEIEEIEGEAR